MTMNFIEDVLERSPASRLGIVAIDAEGNRRDWHFGELLACSAGLSGAFAARGVRRGDVVMTLVGNRVEWALTLLACWRMGAVALPCSPQLRRADLEHRVTAANPALCVGEEGLLGELPDGVPAMTLGEIADVLDEDRPQETPAAIEEMGAEDPALIVFTSGTTGEPRGVVHAYRYLLGQRSQAEHWLGSRKGELVWCTTAPGWSKSARNVFLAPWLTGAAAVIHEGRFDPIERLDFAEALGVNVLCQAPTEYRMLAKRTPLRGWPALRRMVSAGEPLEAETIAAFREATGLEPADGYGQTETGHVSGNLVGDEVRRGSMGKPLPGIETRIVGGELQLRAASSPTFFSRYLDGERFEGEWWRTGDLVREDEDGYLFFEGRDDDIILSSGYRIGPFEVESALLSHPGVAEAAAVAAPDPERGSVVRAIVVPRNREPGEELARELQEHCKRQTAPYKFPRIVEFATELPKTASGKIKRAQLRQG
ncbi:MAG TPA: AMP-binding protein [Solirubrobacterales bacterium]|jgi:acyl-coenzyme A synthetase/AMP-(fatty) acid ligase|nr:AMP-binding protein [Solirubrobacterales bacterium]